MHEDIIESKKPEETMGILAAAKVRCKDWKENLSDHESFYFADYINVLLNDLNSGDIKVYPAAVSGQIETQQIREQKQRYAFIPLNVYYGETNKIGGENHWVALIVDKENEQIFYLDPAIKNQIPENVKKLKKDLAYKDEVILNTIDFQSAEKGGKSILGLIHCGAYVVEKFAAFANKIKEKKSIVSDKAVDKKDQDKVSISSVLSSVSTASGEKMIDDLSILKVRKRHADTVMEALPELKEEKPSRKLPYTPKRSQTQVVKTSNAGSQITQKSRIQRPQTVQAKHALYTSRPLSSVGQVRANSKAKMEAIEKGKRNIGFVYQQLSTLDVSGIAATLEKKIESNWFFLHKSLVEIKTTEETFSKQAGQAKACLQTVCDDPRSSNLNSFEKKMLQEAIQCFQELSVFEGPFSEIALDEKISFPQKADREGIIKMLGLLEQKIYDQNNIFTARALNCKWLIMNEPALRAIILKISPDNLNGFEGLLANVASVLSTQEEQEKKEKIKTQKESEKKINEYSLSTPFQRLLKLVLFAKEWREKLEELGQPLDVVGKIQDKFKADADDAQDYLAKAQDSSKDEHREYLSDFLLKEKKTRNEVVSSDKPKLLGYIPSARVKIELDSVAKSLNHTRKAIEQVPNEDQNLSDMRKDLNAAIDSLSNLHGYSVSGFASLSEKLVTMKDKLDAQKIQIPDEKTIQKIRLGLDNPLLGFVYSQLKGFVSLYEANNNIGSLVEALDYAWAGFYKMQKEEYVLHDFFVSDKNGVKTPQEQSGKNLSLAQQLFNHTLRLKGMIALGDTFKDKSFVIDELKPVLADFERRNLIPFESEINAMKNVVIFSLEYEKYQIMELKQFHDVVASISDEKSRESIKEHIIDVIHECSVQFVDQIQTHDRSAANKKLNDIFLWFNKLQMIAPSEHQFFADNKIDSPIVQTNKLSTLQYLFNCAVYLKFDVDSGQAFSPENIANLKWILPDQFSIESIRDELDLVFSKTTTLEDKIVALENVQITIVKADKSFQYKKLYDDVCSLYHKIIEKKAEIIMDKVKVSGEKFFLEKLNRNFNSLFLEEVRQLKVSFKEACSEKFVLNKICNTVYSLASSISSDMMKPHKAHISKQIDVSLELFKQHHSQFFDQNGDVVQQKHQHLTFAQELFNGLLELKQMLDDSLTPGHIIKSKADELYFKRNFALEDEYARNHLLSFICNKLKVLLFDSNGHPEISALKDNIMIEIWKAFYLMQIKSQSTTKRYFFFDIHDQNKPLIQKGENLSFTQELFNAVYQFMDKKTVALSDLIHLRGILSKQNEQEELSFDDVGIIEPESDKLALWEYINKTILPTVPCPRLPENDGSKEKIKIHHVKDKSFMGAAFLGMVDHILCNANYFETNINFRDEINVEINRARQAWVDLFNQNNIDNQSDWTFSEITLYFREHNTYQAQQALKEKFVPILMAEMVNINTNPVFLNAYKNRIVDKVEVAFVNYHRALTANHPNSIYSGYTESSDVKHYFDYLCRKLAGTIPVGRKTLDGILRELKLEWTEGGLAERFIQHVAVNSDSADREVIAEVCYDLGFFVINNEEMEADLDKIRLFVEAEKTSLHEKAPQWICKASGSDFIKDKPSSQKYDKKEEVKACKGAYLRSVHDVGIMVDGDKSYFRIRQPNDADRVIKADKVISELHEKIKSEDNAQIIDTIESGLMSLFEQWDSQKPKAVSLKKGDVSEHLRSAYNAYRLCTTEQKKVFKLAEFNKNEVIGSYLSHVRNEILPLSRLITPWKLSVSPQGRGFIVWKKQPDAELRPSDCSMPEYSKNPSMHIIETKDNELNTILIEASVQEMSGKNAPLEYAPIYDITSSGVKYLSEEMPSIANITFFSWEWVKREIQELLFYQTEHRNNYASGLVPIDKYTTEIHNKAAEIRVLLHKCVISKILVARQLILAPIMLVDRNADESFVGVAKKGEISLETFVNYFQRDIEKLDKLCEIAELILNEGFIGDEPNDQVTRVRLLLNEISGDNSGIYRCPFARKDLKIGWRRDFFQYDEDNEATGVKTYDNLKYRKLQVIKKYSDEHFREETIYRVTPIGSALNVRIGTPSLKLSLVKGGCACVFITLAVVALGALGRPLGWEAWKNSGAGITPSPTPSGPTPPPTTGEPLPPWVTSSPSSLSPTISPEADLLGYRVEYGAMIAGISLAILIGLYWIGIRPRIFTKVTSVEEVQPEGEYIDISEDEENNDVVIDLEDKLTQNLDSSELGGRRLPEQQNAKIEPSNDLVGSRHLRQNKVNINNARLGSTDLGGSRLLRQNNAILNNKDLDSAAFTGLIQRKRQPVKVNKISDLSEQDRSQRGLRDLQVGSDSPDIADRLKYATDSNSSSKSLPLDNSGESSTVEQGNVPLTKQQKKARHRAGNFNKLTESSIATQKPLDLNLNNNLSSVKRSEKSQQNLRAPLKNDSRERVTRSYNLEGVIGDSEKSIKSISKYNKPSGRFESVPAKLDVKECLDKVEAGLLKIGNIQGKEDILTSDNLAKIGKLSAALTMLKENPALISDEELEQILLQIQVMEEMLGQPAQISLENIKFDLSKNKDIGAKAIYKTAADLAKSLNGLLNKVLHCDVFPDIKLKDKLSEIKGLEGFQHRYNSLRSYFNGLLFDQKDKFVQKHKDSIGALKKLLNGSESGLLEIISGKENILDKLLSEFESDFEIKRALVGEKMVGTQQDLLAKKATMGNIAHTKSKAKFDLKDNSESDVYVDLESLEEGFSLGKISSKKQVSINNNDDSNSSSESTDAKNAGKVGMFKTHSEYAAFTKGKDDADLRSFSQKNITPTKKSGENQPLILRKDETTSTKSSYNTARGSK